MSRLQSLSLGVLAISWVIAPATLRAQQTNQLAGAVQPFVDRHELAGAVMLVADKDGTLAVGVAGWADIEAKQPMTKETMFWIASQTKPITAATVMILVDEGKLSLDDPIEKFLPEFFGQMVVVEKSEQAKTLRKPKRSITVRDTLAHTSGMPFRSALEEPTLDLLPLAARVKSYALTPLDHHPGDKYQYSNAGVNKAARIVEVVSGQSFEEFLAQRLLRPLQMRDTTFFPDEKQAARIARAYRAGPENKGLAPTTIEQLHYPLTDRTVRSAMPAGGLFSTASDVSRFYRMLLNDGELDGVRVLSADAVRQLTMKQTPKELGDEYGLCFSVSGGSFGHGGAYSTNTSADRQTGLALVWLVQHNGFPGEGQKAQEAFRQAAMKAFAAGK